MKVSEPNYVFDLNRVPLRNMAPYNKEYGQPYNFSVLPFVQNDIYKKQYESPSQRKRSKSKEPISAKIGAYSPVILKNDRNEFAHGIPTGARMSPIPSQRRVYPNQKQSNMKQMLYFQDDLENS